MRVTQFERQNVDWAIRVGSVSSAIGTRSVAIATFPGPSSSSASQPTGWAAGCGDRTSSRILATQWGIANRMCSLCAIRNIHDKFALYDLLTCTVNLQDGDTRTTPTLYLEITVDAKQIDELRSLSWNGFKASCTCASSSTKTNWSRSGYMTASRRPGIPWPVDIAPIGQIWIPL